MLPRTANIGASITWFCCEQPENNFEEKNLDNNPYNQHWCINYMTLLSTTRQQSWKNHDNNPDNQHSLVHQLHHITPCQQGSLALSQLQGEVRIQSKHIWVLSTSDSIYVYMKYIQIYLISTTKEIDLRLLFCFHLKLCLTGNVYKVCCSKVSKYPPLAKLCHVWIQNLFLTQIKKKWLNMENKLALSILGDLDQIDWFAK